MLLLLIWQKDMKKVYKQPKIKVRKLHPGTAMLTVSESYGTGIEVTGTEKEPGNEEDFV